MKNPSIRCCTLAALLSIGSFSCGSPPKGAATDAAPAKAASAVGDRMQPVTTPTAIPVVGAKITVIDFIWTGCPSSPKWVAFLGEMKKKCEGRGLAVVGIATLSDETQAMLDEFGTSHHASFPLFADPDHHVATAVAPSHYQSLVIVDAGGVVRAINRGSHDDNFHHIETELARPLER